jgi:hypothetical protein
MIGLAALALVFAASTPSDAGWYKKARKAVKKATHKVEKAFKDAEKEVRTGGMAKAYEKAKADARSTLAKADKDRLRVIDKGFSNISGEMNRFGHDVSAEFKKGLPPISMDSVNKGLKQLDYNKNRGWDHLAENIHGGIRTAGDNIGAGLTKSAPHLLPQPLVYYGPTGVVPFYFGPGAPSVSSGFNQLFGPGGGLDRAGRAIGDELDRGGLQKEIFGGPKVSDTKKSDDEELLTGKVGTALTEKKGKSTEVVEPSETPVAIFRAETDTGTAEPTGGSTTIFKERTSTSGLGSSTGSSSGSSGLGGTQSIGKKESSSSPLSTGGTSPRSSTRRR